MKATREDYLQLLKSTIEAFKRNERDEEGFIPPYTEMHQVIDFKDYSEYQNELMEELMRALPDYAFEIVSDFMGIKVRITGFNN